VTDSLIPSVELLPATPIPIPELEDAATAFASSARSDGTRRAYRESLSVFWRWCSSVGRAPFPASPDTVRLYVNGVQIDNEAYTSIPLLNSSREVLFGAASSAGAGIVELTGASFGLGGQNSAPLLLPEPSVAALGMIGLLLVARKLARRSR
jgi:hypothetical protein